MPLDRATIETTYDDHSAAIRALVPGAQVELSGSALLPGLEPRDVDIVVLTDDVAGAAAALADTYPPLYREHWDDDWAAFRGDGDPQVDVVVTRPGSWGDAHHRRAWQLIAARADLRERYRALDRSGDDYAERKGAFFTDVVSELGD